MVIGMAMTRQPHARQPQGSPTGGQFASVDHPEGDTQLDAPGAQIRGEVSAYAADLATTARDAERAAATQAQAAAIRREAEANKAAELRNTADAKRLIGRWRYNRKASKADQRVLQAEAAQAEAEAYANQASDDAGRMEAGVRAERRVVEALARTPGVHHVLCGLNFGPGVGDIDTIAVGNRVVITEVKAGGGRLVVHADGSVTHGGRATPRNPLEQCAKQVAALDAVTGKRATGVVCFPDAEPSVILHAASGCYLVGGTDNLIEVVSETMDRGVDRVSAKALVTSVQSALAARHKEVQSWVARCDSRTAEIATRIANWQDTINRSGGWSQGPEIRANLTNYIAQKQASAEQVAKDRKTWVSMAEGVAAAYQANERLLGSSGRSTP